MLTALYLLPHVFITNALIKHEKLPLIKLLLHRIQMYGKKNLNLGYFCQQFLIYFCSNVILYCICMKLNTFLPIIALHCVPFANLSYIHTYNLTLMQIVICSHQVTDACISRVDRTVKLSRQRNCLMVTANADAARQLKLTKRNSVDQKTLSGCCEESTHSAKDFASALSM